MAKDLLKKMVGTEPTAFSPLNPSKDLSFISLNLYFRLSSVSVLLMPQQITLCSNEAAEFKTINLLLTAVLSCTSNKSVCLNSHMPVWCCRGGDGQGHHPQVTRSTNIPWIFVANDHWPVAEPNRRLACLLQFRKHLLSISFQGSPVFSGGRGCDKDY